MADPILRVESLSKSFGGLVAADQITLQIDQGSITGLIGPNGSGKTTLFNLVSGALKPDGGRVLFRNSDITGLRPHQVFKKGVYRTFQSPQIIPRLTLIENMLLADRAQIGEGLFPALFNRRRWKEHEEKAIRRAYEHLKFLDIEKYANESPSILSGGQLKLLEIGRALMSDATMLLLDEPAAGVNPTLAAKIFDLLEHLRRERGVTIFVIEHKVDLVFERVDFAFVLNKGRLFFSGTPEEVSREQSVIDVYLGE
ncbi:MAG TPA: ABC transporter ATP-binding protein [Nitrososphaerales archaeon]|nr:ABC transporter ATP-binding protein [Nitrososphaerales archaeon]